MEDLDMSKQDDVRYMTETTDYVVWLRGLAGKGGKGTVNNVDARALGRVANTLDAMHTENAKLREALKPFTPLVDEMYARNWNKGDLVITLGNHSLWFEDFVQLRTALMTTTSQPQERST
jgi:hypothetical protein